MQVEAVRRRRTAVQLKREQLELEWRRWISKLFSLEQQVVSGMGKDIAEFKLKVVDGRVEFATRTK